MSDKNKTENPMADELLREVDEELKEEHFKKLVKKYAPVISCLIVLALVCVGGYEYWNYRKNKQILADDADLTVALDLAKNGKVDESLSALKKMRENASEGYAVLAALHQTTLLLEQGNCYYLEDNTAVYRINEESACRSRDYKKQLRFWISSEEMRLYLFNRLNYYLEVYDKVYDSYLKKCYEYKHLDPSFQPMFDLKIRNHFDYFRFVLKYQYRKLKHKIFS